MNGPFTTSGTSGRLARLFAHSSTIRILGRFSRKPRSIRRCVTSMCHTGDMKKASIRDLHMRTGALVQEAADGEVIVIEKRGVPVAELRQLRKRTAAEAIRALEESGYFVRMGKTNSNIDQVISEDRDRF